MLFGVLGPLDVRYPDGRPAEIGDGIHPRVLSALLLRPNRWVDADSLAEVVWPDRVVARADRLLWDCVHDLRRRTPFFDDTAARIDSRPHHHRVNIGENELDSLLFEELIDIGRDLLDSDAPLAADYLGGALRLWRGVPFTLLDTNYSRLEAQRLADLRWDALGSLVDALVLADRAADAVAALRSAAAEPPGREDTWRRLVAVLRQAGRPIEAAAAARKAARVLGRDLG
ncbi:AfsR/SARP family transcriptional regulator [Amycolatopsis suaedae]|uniref:Bacterial transcriptional activator domain-containing protein n=1 Tax=Amycolatopsis suaedae TaxID=2510978 RepID=A0A4Q7J380_9PSEU|nr:BTAD domain-containing putative transcriptional regulator [Amycolatopsis suaedae]RZQ61238.1 hypothetical protein EWH70_25550 [Amycolatopsis suaedae]